MYFTTLVLFIALIVITLTQGEPSEAQSMGIAQGAFILGAPSNPAEIDNFTSLTGVPPKIVTWYQDWENTVFSPADMDAVASRGAMPVVTWQPHDWNTSGANQPKYTLSTIAAGHHDAYIRQWAQDAAAWGKPMYLRFAHEMNGEWYPWGTKAGNPNGNTPQEYVAAWQHVHDIFAEEGATNVRWIWNPDFTASDRPSYSSLYPGDGYVDWVAIDYYNWGTSQWWSSWQTFLQGFDASYGEMVTLTDKPIMLGETASSEWGGDKAAWIKQTFLTDIPTRYPQVRAVVWFNEDKETDWRVNSSPASLDAYKQVVASPYYQGSLP